MHRFRLFSVVVFASTLPHAPLPSSPPPSRSRDVHYTIPPYVRGRG